MKSSVLRGFSIAILAYYLQPQISIASNRESAKLPQPKTILAATERVASPVANRQIVPGKSVGAIVKTTSYKNLVKLFGAKRLSDSEFNGAEGEIKLPATLVKLGKNKELTVVWKDSKRDRVFMTIVRDPDWQTKNGIRVSMTLPQLRKVAGKFQVSGLGWDYGNIVSFPTLNPNPYNRMGIKVDADENAIAKFPKDYQAVSGEGLQIADDDPRWKNLNMRVTRLEIIYD